MSKTGPLIMPRCRAELMGVSLKHAERFDTKVAAVLIHTVNFQQSIFTLLGDNHPLQL
jgi:hypothetical protein